MSARDDDVTLSDDVNDILYPSEGPGELHALAHEIDSEDDKIAIFDAEPGDGTTDAWLQMSGGHHIRREGAR